MTSPSQNAVACMRLIAERDVAGQRKYHTSMDRDDLKPRQWLRHATEESADRLQYDMRLSRMLDDVVREAYARGRRDQAAGNCPLLGAESAVQELLG